MNPEFEKLHNYFKSFPGIGKRQAERFVYHILSRDSIWVNGFVKEMLDVKKTVSECTECFYIFKNNSYKICQFCRIESVDNKILAIVEKSADIEILTQKIVWNGNFFVLGGQLPVIEKKKSVNIRITELLERIAKLKEKGLEEIVICTSYNPDGVFTASVVKDKIREKFENTFKITTLGRGFSSGTEIEYVDSETLKYAMQNRADF